MTCFAVCMTSIDSKPKIIFIDSRRADKGIATFCTEKVLLMIHSFAECGVVKRNKLHIDNRSFTMITPGPKVLFAILIKGAIATQR